MGAPGPHPLGQLGWQLVEQLVAVDRQRCCAALLAAMAPAGRRRLAVVQQRIELGGHQFADLAQPVEQLAGRCSAMQVHRSGNPGQIGIDGGQQMGLLVVEVLDTVLDLAQEDIGLGELGGGLRLHQAVPGQTLQAGERGAGAYLGKLPAAHHQQQLDDELDLADAAARQLDVVGALRSTRGTALRLFTDLAVQLAQSLEDAVVEIAPVDKSRDQCAQRQRPARRH